MIKHLAPTLLALMLILGSCQKPQSFEYRDIKSFSIDKLAWDAPSTVSMEVVLFNPNNFSVTLKNVNCQVYLNNNFVGNYNLDTTMVFPKNAEFVFPAKMQLDLRNVVNNALALLMNPEMQLNVKGSARVGKSGFFVTLPFDHAQKVDLSQVKF